MDKNIHKKISAKWNGPYLVTNYDLKSPNIVECVEVDSEGTPNSETKHIVNIKEVKQFIARPRWMILPLGERPTINIDDTEMEVDLASKGDTRYVDPSERITPEQIAEKFGEKFPPEINSVK